MKKASDVQLNDDTSAQLSRRERCCNDVIALYNMLDTKKCLVLTTIHVHRLRSYMYCLKFINKTEQCLAMNDQSL